MHTALFPKPLEPMAALGPRSFSTAPAPRPVHRIHQGVEFLSLLHTRSGPTRQTRPLEWFAGLGPPPFHCGLRIMPLPGRNPVPKGRGTQRGLPTAYNTHSYPSAWAGGALMKTRSVQYALRWRLVGNRWRLVCNRWRLVGNRWRLVGNRWRLVGSHQTSESGCHSKNRGGGGECPYGTPWAWDQNAVSVIFASSIHGREGHTQYTGSTQLVSSTFKAFRKHMAQWTRESSPQESMKDRHEQCFQEIRSFVEKHGESSFDFSEGYYRTAHRTTRSMPGVVFRFFQESSDWQEHGSLRGNHTTTEASTPPPHQCNGGCSR